MLKDLIKTQQQVKKMQSKLKNIHIEAEEGGVLIIINGNMEVIKVDIHDDAWNKGKRYIEDCSTKAIAKGMKKAQEVAATNMKDIMGDFGMPKFGK